MGGDGMGRERWEMLERWREGGKTEREEMETDGGKERRNGEVERADERRVWEEKRGGDGDRA